MSGSTLEKSARTLRKHAFALGVVILLGLLPITWFRGDLVIKAGDSFFQLSPWYGLKGDIYTWNHIAATGIPNPGGATNIPYHLFAVSLETLGFSLVASEKILFYILFTLSGLSMYYLSSTLVSGKYKRITALSSAFFYMMNPYTLTNVWSTGFMGIVFVYPLFPVMLGLYIRGLNRKRYGYLFLILCLWLIFSMAVLNPAFAAPIWFVTLSYLGFYLFVNRESKSDIIYALRFTFLLIILYVLLNMAWILPLAASIGERFQMALTSGQPLNIFVMNSRYTSISNVLRLMGMWTLYVKNFPDPYFLWGWVYFTTPFVIISFLVPLLAFLPLVFRGRDKYVMYFTLLSVFGLFLLKGAHPPLSEVNLWIFNNVPFFSIFRAHYEKLAPIVVVGYAFLIGISIAELYNFLRKKISPLGESHQLAVHKIAQVTPALFVVALLAAIEGIYMFPFWTGDVIFGGGEVIPSYRIKVPAYYEEAARWINQQEGEFKTYSLPSPAHEATAAYAWDHGYCGSDPLVEYFFQDRPLVTAGRTGNKAVDDLQEQTISLFDTKVPKETIGRVLGLLNVKYILNHRDFNLKYTAAPPPEHFEKALETQEGISLEKSFGALDFYRNDYLLPHIYASTSPTLVNGDINALISPANIALLEGKPALFLTDQLDDGTMQSLSEKITLTAGNPGETLPALTFNKTNPTRYRVSVENATDPYLLVFSESFHKGWKAYIEPTQKESSPFEWSALLSWILKGRERKALPDHFLVNGYANSWYVDKEGSYDIVLEYQPQRLFEIGIIISTSTLIGCLSYLAWDWRNRRRTKKPQHQTI